MSTIPTEVIAVTVLPTLLGLAVAAVLCGWFRRCWASRAELLDRTQFALPYAAILVVVLLFNALLRPRADELSPAFAVSMTGDIYALEGEFVAWFQSLLPEPILLYFSGVYVVGYAILLAFPLLAYAVLDDPRHLGSVLLAYALNYALGAVAYVAILAYGPRNVYPETVSQPLYEFFPNIMYLTSAVNTNTNVFPSLHTSLSVTVLLFAWLTRDEFPRWLAIAAVVAPSVVLATMALGIHWLIDVLAGVLLAVLSVGVARHVVYQNRLQPTVDRIRRRTPGL